MADKQPGLREVTGADTGLHATWCMQEARCLGRMPAPIAIVRRHKQPLPALSGSLRALSRTLCSNPAPYSRISSLPLAGSLTRIVRLRSLVLLMQSASIPDVCLEVFLGSQTLPLGA